MHGSILVILPFVDDLDLVLLRLRYVYFEHVHLVDRRWLVML